MFKIVIDPKKQAREHAQLDPKINKYKTITQQNENI